MATTLGTGSNSKSYGNGNNTIYANDGNDTIRGGGGKDKLYGQDDHDKLYGQSGDDSLDGGSGNDYLDGGDNRDTLYGGENNDTLYGGGGDDKLYGGNHNDTLSGQQGNDTLEGGSGNDSLEGGDGSDTLKGGDNNDKLEGENGNDSLYGENHDDTLYGQSGDDRLFGGGGNDLLYGGHNKDTLNGGAGDDTLNGGDDNDYLDGDKNDNGSLSSGNDKLSGGNGNDTLYGRGGDDTLNGDNGNDTLYGGDGNDSLNGGAGNDLIDGGGGNYIDTVNYGGQHSVNVDLSSGTATGISIGNDTLHDIEKVIGSTQSDTIKGSSADEIFEGGIGNDTLVGEEGDDSLIGDKVGSTGLEGDSYDSIEGGSGNDTLVGGFDSDTLEGGEGNDLIYGDFINGPAGYGWDDTLSGGSGDDTIDGGYGYNTLIEQGDVDFTLSVTSLTGGFGNDVLNNIHEVWLQGGESNNSFTNNGFTNTANGYEEITIVAYDEKVSDYGITYNETTETWTVNGQSQNQGIDTVKGFDQIVFRHEDESRVSSVFSLAHGTTFVSATAGIDGGGYEITGGDYGPTTYIIGLEGDTTPNISFDTEKLVDFIDDISATSETIENQRMLTKVGFAVAGKAPVPGASVVSKVGQIFADQYFDEQQDQWQDQNIQNVLKDANYDPDSWVTFDQPNRDIVTITDFQIGVDTIALPFLEGDSSVSYGVRSEADGAMVYIRRGTNESQDFLKIENNYGTTYGLDSADFSDLILDLMEAPEEENYNGSTITTFKQTSILVSPNDSVRETGVGSFAGDLIQAANYTGYSSNPDAGTYSLIGKYGDDLIQGGDQGDYLYGGFNGDNDGTPFAYEHDGNDVLQGNEGNDTLVGGSGDDVLYGGLGADTFIFSSTNGTDTIKDFTGSEGDIINIDQSVFGISSLSDVSFQGGNKLFVTGQSDALAVLENQSGFDLATDVVLI